MRIALLWTVRVSFSISFVSMVYLLFVFGHTELAPLNHVVGAATLACITAIIGGVIQWIGLPPDPKLADKKAPKRKVPSEPRKK